MSSEPSASSGRIPPHEAAEKARQFVANLMKGITDPQVEEVELTDGEQFWTVTVGYETRDAVSGFCKTRSKLVKIDARTAEVKSMKIREA